MNQNLEILVAGASGYIGRAVIPLLLEKFPRARITALSRSAQTSTDPRVQWKACDLFSLKSLEEAVPSQGIDIAFYLVHSMGPTAQLDQGSFADYDLILADNFARVMKKAGTRQIIYLGGLIPHDGELSLHLQSRLEVETNFKEHGLPLTVFRAGLILGEEGSSWQILLKLVKRLPIMLCPRWTRSLTTPVDLETVTEELVHAAGDPAMLNRTKDLAGCRPITYLQMMRETANAVGRRRLFIAVPFMTPALSRLWVSVITNTPKNLVYPLVESLQHDMVAAGPVVEREYRDLLTRIPKKTRAGDALFKFRAQRKTVRSVQRLPLPAGRDAEWIKHEYARWLPRFFRPLIKVRLTGDLVIFSWWGLDLLELQLSADRSHTDRQLLYIKKGILVAQNDRGRLEFRVVLGRRFVLAAIHDFKPALPWFVYQYTQALLHVLVMKFFARHLGRIGR